MKKLLLLLMIVPMIGFGQCVSGDCENGYGTYTFDNGDKYVGEWWNGKFHGLGTYTYSNGDKYVGEHKDDKIHGQGTYTYGPRSKNSGDFFSGEYKDGVRNGLGLYVFSKGNGDVSYYIEDKEIKRLCNFEK